MHVAGAEEPRDEPREKVKRINLAEVIQEKTRLRGELKREELEVRRLEATNEAARIKVQQDQNKLMLDMMTRLDRRSSNFEA